MPGELSLSPVLMQAEIYTEDPVTGEKEVIGETGKPVPFFEEKKGDILFYVKIAALIIGGFLLGMIMERVVRDRLKKFAANLTAEVARDIISSMRGITVVLFTIGGAYLAMLYIPMSDRDFQTVQKIFVIGVILGTTIIISRVIVALVRHYFRKMSGILPSTTLLENITRLVIVFMGILILLNTLGISITPILTALGVGGLAVALALQDTLSNLFSGLYIIATKEAQPGHYVKLDEGVEGYVVDISWRNTTIQTITNNIVIIPNQKFASAILTNFHRPSKDMSIFVDVGVAYDSNLRKVRQVARKVARDLMNEMEGAVKDFEPDIRFHTFGDSSINFTVVLRIKEFMEQHSIKTEYVIRLHEAFNKEGIEIPFPIRTVVMKNTKDKKKEETEKG